MSKAERTGTGGPVGREWWTILGLLVVQACGSTDVKGSACQGIDERGMVRGPEYRPCAVEILTALDSLRTQIEDDAAGENTARGRARGTHRGVRDLLDQTGIERDFRSMEAGDVVVRWPDSETRGFNSAAFRASVMYGAVLATKRSEAAESGGQDNFQQGVRAHEEARRHFHQIR